MIINGREIASEILEDLKNRVEKLKEKNVTPHLYIITLGKNSESTSYIKQKILKAEIIKAKTTVKKLSEKTTTDELISLIKKLNSDKKINGIIVQRPMPKTIDEKKIALAINTKKDVDGFHPHSKFMVPVALAVLKAIESIIDDQDIVNFLKSKKITVIGKGITAGKPIINLFEKFKIKIKIIDSKSKERKKILKASDIIISAVGKSGIVTKDDLKKGVILIGVGLHLEKDQKFYGDYNQDEISDKAGFYTPTPGGIGPLNVSMLLKNLVKAAESKN